MSKLKVLVTHLEIPQAALEILIDNCDVTLCEANPSRRGEILNKSQGMDGIFWGTHDKLDAEALDAAGPNLKAISTMSAGLDYVDIDVLKRRGIKLGHTPEVLNEAVADIAVGLMIAAARRFHEGREKIETCTWETGRLNWMLGKDIAGATVGFVGFGGTAQATARRLKGFQIGEIIYFSRGISKYEKEFNASRVEFDDLLRRSDFIFIMCPLTNETQGIFNERAFNQMKPNCVLVNTGRGQIVNQRALYHALKSEKIFAAGLDVTFPEPLSLHDPLISLPNCVIIPHLGSATEKTREQMGIVAAKNVINGMKPNGKMIYPAY